MLRKIGKWRSGQNLDVSQVEPNDTIADDKLSAYDIEGTPPKGRRSSEPLASLYSSIASQYSGGRSSRHASVQEDDPLSSPGHIEQHVAADISLVTNPLGLTLVHACPEPLADLIFVHGLGGTSRSTWSWLRDPQNFWPVWLGQESELGKTRIFSFGYNADFLGQRTPLNILDFAKDLLFRMKTCSNPDCPNDEQIGKYPIVFVMHSMGGLVVKKAYIIGRSDEQYTNMMSHIHGMLFLGTPHRGSAFADFLNNVLRTTPYLSGKLYVSELEKTSNSLQDINEQFRTACSDIELVSLYEGLRTNLGMGVKKMIVDKDSAVLGYPTETSSSLDADHHGMSKFSSTGDPNYIHVRNVLRMFLRSIKSPETSTTSVKERRMSIAVKKKLEELLGISDDPADDLEIMRDRIMLGSCQWILRRQSFLDWTDGEKDNSKLLWLTGLPAVGKSVLSSFIIDHLQKDPSIQNCFYHFFKSEHQTKRTVGQMLRNIAFQIASSNQPFREKLVELYETGLLPLGRQKMSTIWETVFEGILCRQKFSEPVYWIIDGLDEADQPEVLARLFSRLNSNNRFRILIVSRKIRDLSSIFAGNIEVVQDEISSHDTFEDIRSYTNSVVSATLRTHKSQEDICNKVLEKSHGSFLWVTLALEQLRDNWHTQHDLGQVLNDLPEGMEPLYVRMIHLISEQASRPRTIASRILTWTVCSFRPLDLAELEIALASEFGEFVNLKDTITQICANFVVVEKSRVALIHDTARHFLLYNTGGLPMTIDYRFGNEHIAYTCLNFLMNPKKNWKRALSVAQMHAPSPRDQARGKRTVLVDAHPFLSYAVKWWAYHVSLASPQSGLVELVFDFLEHSCLLWINAVALLGDMRTMTRAAQYLKLYVKRRNRKTSNDSLMSLKGNRDDELRQWAKDLIRVVGRFGSILIQDPHSIYKYIIPFCPKGSIISRTYGGKNAISVTGISSEGWDDCLARLTMGNDECGMRVLCKGSYFVILIASGVLVVWHAESCGEARRLHHGEWVSMMEISRVSPLVVTAGTKTIRVWDIHTGKEVFCLPKTYQRRILALSFGEADDELLIGYDDSSIQCIDLTTQTEKWKILAEDPDDMDHICPHLISFSPDASHVITGCRGRPMFAWSLYSPTRSPQKCVRPEDRYHRHHDSWKAGTPECVLWRPELPAVFIIYNDNSLVEWNIEDDTQRAIPHIGARDMAISPDGNLLLTSDHNGALSVWTVPEFRLTYQLQYDDMVRSLAFSPDGQRFYDIRGSLCNVWEPDALVRPDDLDREEFSSTQDTLISEPTSVNGTSHAQITALICDNEDRFYCCGKDSGAVVLHEMRKGAKVRKIYGHSSVASIIELAWTRSSSYIASADDCGRVIVKRLRRPTQQAGTWGVYPLLDFRPGEAVSQLLFSPSEEHLLVSSSTCDWVWSLKDRKEVSRSEHASWTGHKWINHSYDSELVVCIEAKKVRIFNWESLEEVRGTGLEAVEEDVEEDEVVERTIPQLSDLSIHHTTSGEPQDTIERVIQVDTTKIVFEVCPSTGSHDTYISRRRITLLDIASLHGRKSQQEPHQGMPGQASRLIGSFQGQVVFLDHQYCFCTWNLNTASNSLERHFFLPKDWLNPGMVKLCIMTKYGTILCPKDGEVAIIRAGFKL